MTCPVCGKEVRESHYMDRPGEWLWYVRCECASMGATHTDRGLAWECYRRQADKREVTP